MKRKKQFSLFGLLLFVLFSGIVSAQEMPLVKAKISVSPEMKSAFLKDGRLILRLTKVRGKDPRKGTELTIGVTALNWDGKAPFFFSTIDKNVLVSGNFVEKSRYEMCYFQVFYKQDIDDGKDNVAGNLFAKVGSVKISTV